MKPSLSSPVFRIKPFISSVPTASGYAQSLSPSNAVPTLLTACLLVHVGHMTISLSILTLKSTRFGGRAMNALKAEVFISDLHRKEVHGIS